MKVNQVLPALLAFAEENQLDYVLRCRSFLDDCVEAFGDREVDDVSSLEMASLAKAHDELLGLSQSAEQEQRAWDDKWQQYYHHRYVLKQPARLPWQWSPDEPTSILQTLFRERDLHPERVLDLGCGDGVDSAFMAARAGRVDAVDISAAAVEIARSNASKQGVGNCEFLARDIFDLGFEEDSFDFILDKGCLHHVPFFRHGAYVDLVSGLTAPGGLFFLICHSLDIGRNAHPLRFLEGMVYPYLGVFAKALRFAQYRQTESVFTEKEIRDLFSGQFEILEITRPDRGDGNPNPLACLMSRK